MLAIELAAPFSRMSDRRAITRLSAWGAGVLAAALVGGAALVVLRSGTDPTPSVRFTVREGAPGLDYVNVSGGPEQLGILEQNGQGIALLDFDGDGRLDIFVTNGGRLEAGEGEMRPGSRLYRNLGDWRFEDATDRAGARVRAWGNGAAAADFDDDGDVDLYVAVWGANVLLRNRGDGSFEQLQEPGGLEVPPTWSSSAVFADFDGDGRLDLYVSNYVDFDPEHVPATEEDGSPCLYRGVESGCGPWRYPGQQDALLLQRSDGSFEDVSAAWGLAATSGSRGMGIAAGDFDGDGDVDVYVGCDVMPNLYLENVDEQRFRSVGVLRGGALNGHGLHESSMGVAAADLFNRGALDLLTTNFAGETNTCFRNEGGDWRDVTEAVGFGGHAAELGWGVVVADFDGDGWRDALVANGQIYPQVEALRDPVDRYAQPPRLFLGRAPGRLEEAPPERVFRFAGRRRGGDGRDRDPKTVRFSLRAIAAGDLDDDGDLDVVAVQHNGPLVLFENRSSVKSGRVVLRTRSDGRSPHGTRLAAGGWHHFHWPVQGYQASHDPRVLVPPTVSVAVLVQWPDGSRQRRPPPAPGTTEIWYPRRLLEIARVPPEEP